MAAAPDPRLTDRGAQLERTSLAWSRTALAMAACGGLLVRQGLIDDVAALVVLGCLVLAASAAVWLLAASRYTRRQTQQRTTHLLVGHRYPVRVVTALAVVISCLAAGGAVPAMPFA